MTLITPITGQSVIPRLALDIVYLYTKFGHYGFSHSGDTIAGTEIENGSCDPDHASFRGGLSTAGVDCYRLRPVFDVVLV